MTIADALFVFAFFLGFAFILGILIGAIEIKIHIDWKRK